MIEGLPGWLFCFQLGVVVAPHALRLPEDPITRWGEYWCDVTVRISRILFGLGGEPHGELARVMCFLPTDLWLFLFLMSVQVNGLDTVRVPMSVVLFRKPKTKRYKHWLAQQAAKITSPQAV